MIPLNPLQARSTQQPEAGSEVFHKRLRLLKPIPPKRSLPWFVNRTVLRTRWATTISDSAEILQHVSQPGAITSDAMRFDGIAIDTANYALARGVRAFGVRTRHSHLGGISSSDETLRLYVPQGSVLKPVLAELTMNTSANDRGGECNEARGTARTVAIGSASNQGYAQLFVSEVSTRQEVKTRKGRWTEAVSRSSRRYVLPFDGTQYVLPVGLR